MSFKSYFLTESAKNGTWNSKQKYWYVHNNTICFKISKGYNSAKKELNRLTKI